MKTTSVKTQVFEGLFTAILLIAVFTLIFSVLSLGSNNYGISYRNAFSHLGERPSGEALEFGEIPTDNQELIEMAANMYLIGGTNAKNSDAVAAYCACLMKMDVSGFENYVDIDASVIKTQDEYFRIDYRLEKDLPFKEMLGPIADAFEMVITERTYTNKEFDVLKYQKVRNSSRDEDGIPSANWSQQVFNEDRTKPVFNSTQEGIFELVGYNISADTISSANIEYVESEQGNFYRVRMVLNTSNPHLTARVIDTIRKGSSDPNANFQRITYDFELWDNGYFKTVNFYEIWTAAAMGFISFSTTSDYRWSFSYSEEDANPDNYIDCQQMIEALETELS